MSIPGTGISSAPDIARDAAALNDAYSRAASGQILLNVLRARDRWPRQYVTLNGFTNNPTVSMGGTLMLDPIPLGTSAPWDASNAQIQRSQGSTYSYGVTPLDTATINNAVLAPVSRGVFEHYWSSGWSRDVVLLVMAESMRRFQGPGAMLESGRGQRLSRTAVVGLRDEIDDAHWSGPMFNSPTNEDARDGDPCVADLAFADMSWPASAELDMRRIPPPTRDAPLTTKDRRCAFFAIIHRMAQWMREGKGVRLRDLPPAACRESDSVDITTRPETVRAMTLAAGASNGGLVMRFAPSSTSSEPANRVVIAGCPQDASEPILLEVFTPSVSANAPDTVHATYLLSLRSLDEMIYAMGVLLRAHPADHLRLARSPNCVEATDQLPRNCVRAPLFELHEDGNARDFAASVDYRGDRVFAGPAVQMPGDAQYDRTATVVTLLTQLFALATSSNSSRPSPSPVPTIVVN